MASSLIVPVAAIDAIAPHPAADRLEVATVLGWQIVVPKAKYRAGDKVVYFPPNAIVPVEHSDRFGVTRYLDKGRVKCARLRGVPSYGFLAPLDDPDTPIGTDLREHFGVTKWLPPARPMQHGAALPDHPSFPRYTDLENVRNYPNVFAPGEEVVLTEKVHGTNVRVGIVRGERMAGSHNVRRALPTENLHRNAYWLPWTLPAVEALLTHFAASHERVVLYGETFGRGVQSFHYGAVDDLQFAAFDLLVGERYLDHDELRAALQQFGVAAVPVIWQGPFALGEIARHAAGKTTYGADHIREGVVVRPLRERYDERIGRVVMKFVSDDFLLDEGRSDYTET